MYIESQELPPLYSCSPSKTNFVAVTLSSLIWLANFLRKDGAKIDVQSPTTSSDVVAKTSGQSTLLCFKSFLFD